jgi:hypothetical protein
MSTRWNMAAARQGRKRLEMGGKGFQDEIRDEWVG